MSTGPNGLLERREALVNEADRVLTAIEQGRPDSIGETQAIDFKEEAGRRTKTGELQPGETTNSEAAIKLADEVCCMANTPGGGLLILGVDDKTLEVLGTELDAEWLRYRIYSAVDVAPAIEERRVSGQRVLLLLVAESPDPVQDTSDRIRWRVGDHCAPVDRSEWWLHRESLGGMDEMARASSASAADITPATLQEIRSTLGSARGTDWPADLSDTEILTRIGALRGQHLTRAAKLLFTPANRSLIRLSVFDVSGGEVLNALEGDPQTSLLEQLNAVEEQITVLNSQLVFADRPSFSERRLHLIPPRAAREAVLNALIHRDWNTLAQTEITWIAFDHALTVISPGGFVGDVNAENILTLRHARYPALADLFRALHLVDKQGVGVDRMYQQMITQGHEPPIIVEEEGPRVRCTLVGGHPSTPILDLVDAIRPIERQRDVRIAVLLHALLNTAFLTRESAAAGLQTDLRSTEVALRAAAASTVDAQPLIEEYKGCWLLGETARQRVSQATDRPQMRPLLPYQSTGRSQLRGVAMLWLQEHAEITTGDLIRLTGVSRPTASSALQELDGGVLQRTGAGRATAYVLRPSGEGTETRGPVGKQDAHR